MDESVECFDLNKGRCSYTCYHTYQYKLLKPNENCSVGQITLIEPFELSDIFQTVQVFLEYYQRQSQDPY